MVKYLSVVYMIAWDTPIGIIDRGRLALIIVYRETRLIRHRKRSLDQLGKCIKAADWEFSFFQCAIQSSFHIYSVINELKEKLTVH